MADDYCGMAGKLGPKEKEAVDGLIRLLAEANKYPIGTLPDGSVQDIVVVGKFTHCKNLDDAGQPEFGLWRVGEVSFGWKGGPGPGISGGSSVMLQSNTVGMLKACEDYLEEFHTPPYRPEGWESDIDLKAEAEWRLRDLWKPEEEPDAATAPAEGTTA